MDWRAVLALSGIYLVVYGIGVYWDYRLSHSWLWAGIVRWGMR